MKLTYPDLIIFCSYNGSAINSNRENVPYKDSIPYSHVIASAKPQQSVRTAGRLRHRNDSETDPKLYQLATAQTVAGQQRSGQRLRTKIRSPVEQHRPFVEATRPTHSAQFVGRQGDQQQAGTFPDQEPAIDRSNLHERVWSISQTESGEQGEQFAQRQPYSTVQQFFESSSDWKLN